MSRRAHESTLATRGSAGPRTPATHARAPHPASASSHSLASAAAGDSNTSATLDASLGRSDKVKQAAASALHASRAGSVRVPGAPGHLSKGEQYLSPGGIALYTEVNAVC